MADKQILPLGDEPTPVDYVVPDAQEVTIGAVYAHFDGSGAGAAFVPSVEVISDSDHKVLAVDQDGTIAAGDEGDASWAPFLKQAEKGGGGGGGISWAYQASPATKLVPQGTHTVIAPTTATGFFTNDTSLFAQGTDTIGGTTYYGIKFIGSAGLYISWASLSPFGTITAGVDYSVEPANPYDPDEADFSRSPTRRLAVAGDTPDAQTLSWTQLGTIDAGPMPSASLYQGSNHNGVADFHAFLSVLVICLDPNQSTFVG